MSAPVNISEEPEWYFLDKADANKPRGPVSERDLDVMLKTGLIDSMTFVWRRGLPNWSSLNSIDDLRRKIIDTSSEFLLDSAKAHSAPKPSTALLERRRRLEEEKEEEDNDAQDGKGKAEGKDQDKEEDEKIDEMFMNLLRNSLAQEDAQLASLLQKDDAHKEEKPSGKKKKKSKQKEIDMSLLTEEEIKKYEKNRRKTMKAAEKKKSHWYNSKINSYVYVTGLPPDITKEELVEFFSKCGVLRLDHATGEERIKVYHDDEGKPKGDALISYARIESIPLAIEMLHDREIKPGYKVHIDKAQFEQKGDYKPREKKKIDPIKENLIRTAQEQMLTWDETEEGKGLKIVVLKNMFTPDQASDPQILQELREDILAECEEKLGEVQRLTIFENHPEGVVQVKFKEAQAATDCIQLMDGRWFDGRKVECFYWDGVTDYKRARENEQDEKKRIEEFGEWLESQKD